MKKTLTIGFITVAVVLLALGIDLFAYAIRTNSISKSEKEVKFLTFSDEKLDYLTELKTDEGVTFSCESHYVMSGKAASGLSRSVPIAVFSLERKYLEENDYQSEKIDSDFKLSSNSKIVMIQYLDYERQIIATKKLSSNVVTIPQTYKDVYVDEIVVFVEKNGETYQVTFARVGA